MGLGEMLWYVFWRCTWINQVLDHRVSHTKNKWNYGSCTGLNTNGEYFYQKWIPVLLVLICDHVLSFFRLEFSSDN